MKIANTADWHIRGEDLEVCRKQLQALVDKCLEKNVDLLTIAGDVFDNAGIGDKYASTGAQTKTALRAAIGGLWGLGAIQVVAVPGNHDFSGSGSDDALHIFENSAAIVIRDTKVFGIHGKRGTARILCLPWRWGNSDPRAEIENALDEFDGEIDLLLGHVQVVGARMSGTFTCEGKPGAWQISREFLESIPVKRIALGDFHARQDLTGGRGGYVGALRQLDFGDEGNPQGFEIWNTETGEVEWVELDAAPVHRIQIVKPGDEVSASMDDSVKRWIKFDGITPNREQVVKLEGMGIRVDQLIPTRERIKRADVPEGVINDPRALIHLWSDHQEPRIEGQRLEQMLAMYDSLQADRQKQEVAA